MARTVDHISGGRLILGIGAGWFKRDYDEYGYEFGTAGTRLSALRDALPRIENRMAQLNPPPVREIPILIGGGGERRTLRYTARHADIWHGWGRPEVIRHKCQVLDEWCVREGRDPNEIERSCGANPAKPETGDSYVEAGATLITLSFDGRDRYDMSPLGDWVAWRDQRNRA
jgi:alkanesulfonate monooxygenase SsuD/methylene tetrahydromethanopterin reductase-like flavin-dependent oxidoreductase (luciferase family)